MGTANRHDDTIAAFSSRGPTAVDRAAKPDVVAPGVGIESLSDPASAFYTTKSAYLLAGTVSTSYLPYLSLSGTSVAAPVVSGTVALLLQANPALTPNAVKAILQYTSQVYPGYDALTQGAGFINAKGAVDLARFLSDTSGVPYPESSDWGARLIWANHREAGGRLRADANAWANNVVWGSALTPTGQQVEWGTLCSSQASPGRLPSPDRAPPRDLSSAAMLVRKKGTIAWPDTVASSLTKCLEVDEPHVAFESFVDTVSVSARRRISISAFINHASGGKPFPSRNPGRSPSLTDQERHEISH